jgi:hypothetical protein
MSSDILFPKQFDGKLGSTAARRAGRIARPTYKRSIRADLWVFGRIENAKGDVQIMASGTQEGSISFERRPAQPGDMVLTEKTTLWMASLSEELRPESLATHYPRITNLIAEQWRQPTKMDKFFDEVFVDSRGGRKGFPFSVLMELTTLKNYYYASVFPRYNS